MGCDVEYVLVVDVMKRRNGFERTFSTWARTFSIGDTRDRVAMMQSGLVLSNLDYENAYQVLTVRNMYTSRGLDRELRIRCV